SSFLDRATMTVKATKLNLRGGPGENFSVLGRLQKGDSITEIQSKGDWTEIQPPASAYAFVAAQYLTQEIPAIAASTPEPAPESTSTVGEPLPVAPAAEIPALPPLTNDLASAETSAMSTNELTSVPEIPVEAEPPPPRIVQREGLVRSTLSIQAPTKFELVSPDNFRPINYLYSSSTNLDLSRYKGLHIIVTGEEGLDERWRNTPVITIQRIQVLD
ncbi:MAG: SH3 domain-containing protein, partial [Verrucomicrobiota bacterium]